MRWLCVYILFGTIPAMSQLQEVATPFSGMADAACAVSSPWSVFSNQAGIARLSTFSGGLSYKCFFDLSELSTKAVFVLYPSVWGNWGAIYSHFGYEKYNEQLVGVVYSKQLARWLDVGVKINYWFAHIDQQKRPRDAFFVEIGMLYSFMSEFRLGLHVTNPGNMARLNLSGSSIIDEVYSLGVAWEIERKFLMTLQADIINRKNRYAVGIQYSCFDFLDIKCGFRTVGSRLTTGVDFNWEKMTIGVSYATHSRLGNSTNITLGVVL